MRDILERVAAGDLSPAAAEARLRGHVRTEAGRFDATRADRAGVPEAVLADGRTPAEAAAMVAASLETTGRPLATRADGETVTAITDLLADEHPGAAVRADERVGTVVVHGPGYEPPEIDATVGVVTAGTSDAVPAGEAATDVREMGAAVREIEDAGVAGIHRLFDRLDDLRETDVLVVAAGREGALPTVVAGLVDVPVVGLPVATGYGHGGDGEAAHAGMLQSCTALSVVNVDAGFTAGAQAGLIARAVSDARDEGRPEGDVAECPAVGSGDRPAHESGGGPSDGHGDR